MKSKKVEEKSKIEDTIKQLSEEIKEDDTDSKKWFLRAKAYMKAKQFKNAIQDFIKVLDITEKKTFDILHLIGKCYMKVGKLSTGAFYFQECIKLNSEHVPSYNGIGVYFYMSRNFNLAFNMFQKALLCDDKCANSYFHMGNMYRKMESYDVAIKKFGDAIELNENHHKAYLARALCCVKKKKFEKALSDVNKAISIKPKKNYYFNRAVIHREMKNIELAIKDLDHVIELDNPRDVFFYTRGEIHEENGRYEKAILDFDNAMLLSPSKPYILQHKKNCQAKLASPPKVDKKLYF